MHRQSRSSWTYKICIILLSTRQNTGRTYGFILYATLYTMSLMIWLLIEKGSIKVWLPEMYCIYLSWFSCKIVTLLYIMASVLAGPVCYKTQSVFLNSTGRQYMRVSVSKSDMLLCWPWERKGKACTSDLVNVPCYPCTGKKRIIFISLKKKNKLISMLLSSQICFKF